MSQSSGNVISITQYLRRKAGELIKGIGFCASFSSQRDWAFDYAFALARHHKTKLNIFYFLSSPYTLRRDMVFADSNMTKTAPITPELLVSLDREIREKYDDRLEDYEKVGFRLCEGNDEWELWKCLKRREYEILVLGYNHKGGPFAGGKSLEEFSNQFKAPVVLVGPDVRDSFYLNERALHWMSELMIPPGKWKRIGS